MEEKVGVRMDGLVAQFAFRMVGAGREARSVASHAGCGGEKCPAPHHLRITEVALRSHPKQDRVTVQLIQLCVADFGRSGRCLAVEYGKQLTDHPHVAVEGMGDLVDYLRLGGLVGEPAQTEDEGIGWVWHETRPPGNTVTIGINRISQSKDGTLRDGFKQAEPDQWLGQAE